jgi:hypothetical protein
MTKRQYDVDGWGRPLLMSKQKDKLPVRRKITKNCPPFDRKYCMTDYDSGPICTKCWDSCNHCSCETQRLWKIIKKQQEAVEALIGLRWYVAMYPTEVMCVPTTNEQRCNDLNKLDAIIKKMNNNS